MTGKENQFPDFLYVRPDLFDWKLEHAVHVWKFPVLSGFSSYITDSERVIAQRFRFEEDRNRFITGRTSLRYLLSNYLSKDPMDIHIVSEKGQKPFVDNPGTPIHFNISHSGQWIVVAFAQDELGIDLEKINSSFDYTDLLHEHFSLAEQQYVARDKFPVSAFYFLWTRKEAVVKAGGSGLYENLQTVSVLEDSSQCNGRFKKWMLKSFSISPDYPVSVAYCSEPVEISYFDGSHLLSGI